MQALTCFKCADGSCSFVNGLVMHNVYCMCGSIFHEVCLSAYFQRYGGNDIQSAAASVTDQPDFKHSQAAPPAWPFPR